MMVVALSSLLNSREPSRSNEEGWALLGLLLALGVMSIVLVSTIVPNVQMQVQRDKEAEMLYRGDQMARGIARYYARGNLAPLSIQLLLTSPYGSLKELAKLRDGVTLGVREIKFVRPSAMIDPISNSDWEPIRVRDPRLMKFLQAWLLETQTVDTNPYRDYFLIAGPPQKDPFKKTNPSTSNPPPGVGTPPRTTPPNNSNRGNQQVRPPGQTSDDDDDDDDDDDVSNDPLASLFQSGSAGFTNPPIVAVAPKKKGKATTTYFGFENYEDWIFIYIPKNMASRSPRVSQ